MKPKLINSTTLQWDNGDTLEWTGFKFLFNEEDLKEPESQEEPKAIIGKQCETHRNWLGGCGCKNFKNQVCDICQGVKGGERDVEEGCKHEAKSFSCDYWVCRDCFKKFPYQSQPKEECMSTLTRVFLQKLKDYYPGKEFKLVEDGSFTRLLFADKVAYLGVLSSVEPSVELLTILDEHFSNQSLAFQMKREYD